MISLLLSAFSELCSRGDSIIGSIETASNLPLQARENSQEVIRYLRTLAQDARRCAVACRAIKGRAEDFPQSSREASRLFASYLREFHRLSREIDAIEEHFAGHIARFNARDVLLTTVAARLWNELNLVGVPPLVVATTSGYYNTVPDLNIIFTPLTAAESLLTVPDLGHEFGHLVHRKLFRLFDERFRVALAEHETRLNAEIRQISRPVQEGLISEVSWIWRNRWAEEVACDTFAAMLLGPAYGWCNIHLCIKKPDFLAFGTHPADDARTKHIIRVLRRREAAEAEQMECIWRQYTNVGSHRQPSNYHDFHCDSLFIAVMEDVEAVLEGVVGNADGRNGEWLQILNEAWRMFLSDAPNRAVWEKSKLAALVAQ